MNTNVRDLSDPTLWERSLARAKHRRHIAELSRRSARRRKATSVAVAGAVVTAPVTPLLTVGGGSTDAVAAGGPLEPTVASNVLLERGSLGDAVAQVQRRLGVVDDGIFGPITERAVRRFQAAHGLAPSGVVDAVTWAAIFRSQVTFMKSSAPVPARALPDVVTRSAPRVVASNPRRAAAQRPASTPRPVADRGGAPKRASRALERDLVADPAPAPRPASPVAALSDDCSTVTPVKGVRTGDFGEDRGTHAHAGIDIAAPSGTPVRAAACGRIVEAGVQSGYGNLVCIEHAGGTTTCYAHLARIDARMRQWVKSGQVIGTVGCTGRCTGPHLHFEVRQNGRPVDPSGYVNGTRSLPRGEGGTGGSYPGESRESRTTPTSASASAKRASAPAETSTWGTGAAETGGSGWSGERGEARVASAPAAPEPVAPEAPPAEPAAAAAPEPVAPEPVAPEAPPAEPAAGPVGEGKAAAAAPPEPVAAPEPAAVAAPSEPVAAPEPAAVAAPEPPPMPVAAEPPPPPPAPEPAAAAAPAPPPAPEPAAAAAPEAPTAEPAAGPVGEGEGASAAPAPPAAAEPAAPATPEPAASASPEPAASAAPPAAAAPAASPAP